MIEPSKREFALADPTIGLLAGFGFVVMYSALGMPIARYADRANRRNVVALGLAFWSALTQTLELNGTCAVAMTTASGFLVAGSSPGKTIAWQNN